MNQLFCHEVQKDKKLNLKDIYQKNEAQHEKGRNSEQNNRMTE